MLDYEKLTGQQSDVEIKLARKRKDFVWKKGAVLPYAVMLNWEKDFTMIATVILKEK